MTDRQPTGSGINDVNILARREIEARIAAPLIEAMAAEFGRDRVLEIAREVIVKLAREQGEQVAGMCGGNTLTDFAGALDLWRKGNALEIDVLEQTGDRFSFNVTRCRYAEMYRGLGIPELGALFSCNRDYAMVEGFNPEITLTRTQTIMGGAPHCDFRFRREARSSAAE